MREIAPGLWHFTAHHPGIGQQVSSYWLARERVLIDPMGPPPELRGLPAGEAPTDILLSCRHHWRRSSDYIQAYGCVVHASRPGLHEFSADQPVEPFDFGAELPGGVIAHEVDAISPDETALEVPAARALCLADGAIRTDPQGPLEFVPDELIGDDPEAVKEALRAALGRLLALDFDDLLLAHGDPVVGDGKEALRAFVEGR
jgi:hypothetical protein